ncbi:MAG: response regulator transcription factor [Thermodesulfobacteriota bacterium]|nr:response regulator transcription factor [Thermodesulfobacteriota bacterium]
MAKEKILIVDDEKDILELLRLSLERDGYQVACAASGEKALELVLSGRPDLVVLDLMLPGIDGLEVARAIRNDDRIQGTPILMLSAKGEESDIITGLELGADDYITKPFSPKILIARIRSVLRRQQAKAAPSDPGRTIAVSGITIHPQKHTVEVNGKKIDLTPSEFDILSFLASRPGLVFTRWQIVDKIRGEHYAVTDRSVDVLISGLRKKLEDYGEYVETVRGVGYRFREIEE